MVSTTTESTRETDIELFLARVVETGPEPRPRHKQKNPEVAAVVNSKTSGETALMR